MSKLKLPTKSPKVDMTPMVDLFSLLLTFFMLTTSFRPSEAILVDTPNSISEKQAPDKNLVTISISNKNRVYYNMDNGRGPDENYRSRILEKMGEQYKIKFAKVQTDQFAKLSSFGLPMQLMENWLKQDSKGRDEMQKDLIAQDKDGIPLDSADNQLAMWVRLTRTVNPRVEVAIKGDTATDYTVLKKVLDILQENQVNKFNLITNLEKVEIKLDKK